jgi:hypothetical protein
MRRTVLALASLLLASLVLAGRRDLLFEIEDPRGDDRGEGTLVYPLGSDLAQGDLDLVRLTARADRGGTTFEATFARPVRVPGERAIDLGGGTLADTARHGFYTTNLDLYVDLDRQPGSGSVNALPGRRVEIDPAFGWERVICLTPRPNEARAAVKRMMARTLKKEARQSRPHVDPADDARIEAEVARDVERKVFFPTQIRVTGPTIRFWVPGEVLDGPARPTYGYAIAVSGADIAQKLNLGARLGLGDPEEDALMILPVGPTPSTERFGGGRDGDPAQPQVIDVVVPAGTTQKAVLGTYDARTGQLARLPGIVPAERAAR